MLDELAATGSTGEDAGDLPLLEASAYEALRLSPPATLAGNRMPTSDTEFAGRRIPAGTVLTPAVYLAHRHPDRFSEPDRFVPDRFRGRKVPPSQYFPFGGGTRHCLGRELALLERADLSVDLQHLGAFACRERHRIGRREGADPADDPSQQGRHAHLLESVELVVAGRSVGAEADRDARGPQLRHLGDPGTKLEVR